MLWPLPRETVFEARERSRRATRRLLLLLVLLYAVFFNVLVFASGWAALLAFSEGNARVAHGVLRLVGERFWALNVFLSLLGAWLAWLHLEAARRRPLDTLLDDLSAVPADPRDDYHARFINLVHEAEAATGIRPIRPVILASTGSNAFSLADGVGRCAIGATDGLLSRLTRPELSAVVAHEAAHLAHEDSALATTVAALTAPFEKTARGMKAALEGGPQGYGRGRGPSALLFFIWAVASLQSLVMHLLSMALSRGREYLADSAAVRMCKDPVALAEALTRISRRHRGSLDIPRSFASLFILNPDIYRLDEQSGLAAELFSTHPPVRERIARLLAWARRDLSDLTRKVESEKKIKESAPPPEPGGFYARKDGAWSGPYTPMQMLALGLLTPQAWIAESADAERTLVRAGDHPLLLPLLDERIREAVVEHRCPRCHVRLVGDKYEGAPVWRCAFCAGHLLPRGVLERIITRRDRGFSEEEREAARAWRETVRAEPPRRLKESGQSSRCPLCASTMITSYHTLLTRVILDRCSRSDCRAVWCDAGELETIQILIEEAAPARPAD